MKTIMLIFFLGIMILFSLIARANPFDRQYQLIKQSGDKISLDYQNIDVRVALELLAESAHMNIVISDSVNGNITLHLNDVAWQQALNIILQTQRLYLQRVNNTLMIFNYDSELTAKNHLLDLEQLQSALIQINYANATTLATILQKSDNTSILSKRGSVGVDARTNSLWVQDIPEKVAEVTKLVHKLDVPVKQVLILARIVNIDKNFERDLGIHWNIGANDNNQIATNSSQESMPSTAIKTVNGMHMDLPTTNIGQLAVNSLSFTVAKLAKGVLLDLELSALENQGYAEIIATPQIMTANQSEALIEAGEDIPYQNTTVSGATAITFRKAVLSLRVTPQITANDRIIINLTVNQDKRGAQVIQGVPLVDTRVIQTQVLVNNGQTIVLGGIYQQATSKDFETVPILHKLPLLGNLFQRTTQTAQQRELLVFVTPKIINQ